jgi:ABC-type glycerol-3-phosphate transport system permease component
MTGWDFGVYMAGTVLIIGPLIVFFFYLKEILRNLREDDFGSK